MESRNGHGTGTVLCDTQKVVGMKENALPSAGGQVMCIQTQSSEEQIGSEPLGPGLFLVVRVGSILLS